MSHSFHPTPHQWMRLSQIFACIAAALTSVVIGRVAGSEKGLRAVIPALTFFAVAFATRCMLQETQSRLQILAFVAAAALLEWIRSKRLGEGFGGIRWLLTAGSATAGVLLAKHLLEPGSISFFMLQLCERFGLTPPSWLGGDL